MNRYALWQYLIIAVSLLLGLLYTLPNFFGESPAVQISLMTEIRSAIESKQFEEYAEEFLA